MKSFLSFIFIDGDSVNYTQIGNLKEIKILHSNKNNFEDEDLILNMANVEVVYSKVSGKGKSIYIKRKVGKM